MDRTLSIPLPANLDSAAAMNYLVQLGQGLYEHLRQSAMKAGDTIQISEPPVVDDTFPNWYRHIHFRRGWRHGLTLTLRWDFRKQAPQAELRIGRATRVHDTLGVGLTVPLLIVGALPGIISGRKWRFAIGLAVGGILGLLLCMVLGAPLAAIALLGSELEHQALADGVIREAQGYLTRVQVPSSKRQPGAAAA
jgi:hypothetical protein